MGSQDRQLFNFIYVFMYFLFYFGGGGGGAVPRLCLHAVQIPYSGHVIMREVNVKITLHKKIKVCGIQPVILNTKTAIKRRLIDVFKTLIDSMRNLSDVL